MDFSEVLTIYNSLFTKNKINFIFEYSIQTNIMFIKWLIREPELLPIIRPLFDYLFFISPKHFFILLYTHIPKRIQAPKIKKKSIKTVVKNDKVLNKVKEVLNWSDIELEKSKKIIDKVILNDRKHWEREFGLK